MADARELTADGIQNVLDFHFFNYLVVLNMLKASTIAEAQCPPKKLALAQAAFREFHSRCFWFLRDEVQITGADIPEIVRGVRAHGHREAFFIAAKLCR